MLSPMGRSGLLGPMGMDSGNATLNPLAQLNNGLALQYTFDSADISGSTIADKSVNGFNGTLFGSPSTVAGIRGQALNLISSSTQYVAVPHNTMLQPYPMSVAFWIKANTNTQTWAGIIGKYAAGSNNGWNLFRSDAGNGLKFYYFKDASNYINNSSNIINGIIDNIWHHIVITVDASGANGYLDGSNVSTLSWIGTVGAPTSTDDLRIGLYASFAPSMAIDDLWVHNRVLSAQEISALYNLR